MYAWTDKTKKIKNQSIANNKIQKQSNWEGTFQLLDKRSETFVQRKKQDITDNSLGSEPHKRQSTIYQLVSLNGFRTANERERYNEVIRIIQAETGLSESGLQIYLKNEVKYPDMKIIMDWDDTHISALDWTGSKHKSIFGSPSNYAPQHGRGLKKIKSSKEIELDNARGAAARERISEAKRVLEGPPPKLSNEIGLPHFTGIVHETRKDGNCAIHGLLGESIEGVVTDLGAQEKRIQFAQLFAGNKLSAYAQAEMDKVLNEKIYTIVNSIRTKQVVADKGILSQKIEELMGGIRESESAEIRDLMLQRHLVALRKAFSEDLKKSSYYLNREEMFAFASHHKKNVCVVERYANGVMYQKTMEAERGKGFVNLLLEGRHYSRYSDPGPTTEEDTQPQGYHPTAEQDSGFYNRDPHVLNDQNMEALEYQHFRFPQIWPDYFHPDENGEKFCSENGIAFDRFKSQLERIGGENKFEELKNIYELPQRPSVSDVDDILDHCLDLEKIKYQFLMIQKIPSVKYLDIQKVIGNDQVDPNNKWLVLKHFYIQLNDAKKVTDIVKYLTFGITPDQTKLVQQLYEATNSVTLASKNKQELKTKLGIGKTRDLEDMVYNDGYDHLLPRPDAPLLENAVKEKLKKTFGDKLATPERVQFAYELVYADAAKKQDLKERASGRLGMIKQKLIEQESKYTNDEVSWIEKSGLTAPKERTGDSKKYSKISLKLSGLKESIALRNLTVNELEQAGTGSSKSEAELKLSAGVGNELVSVGGFIKIKHGRELSIADDRRFRSSRTTSGTLGGEVSALFETIGAFISGAYARGTTEVFSTSKDYLLYDNMKTYDEIMSICDDSDNLKLDDDSIKELDNELKLNYDDIKSQKEELDYTKVYTQSWSGEAGAEFPFLERGSKVTSTNMKFVENTKSNEKLKAKQLVHSKSLKIGAFGLDITYTKVHNHKIRDNDGEYRNIKITCNQPINIKLKRPNDDSHGTLIDTVKNIGDKIEHTELIKVLRDALTSVTSKNFPGEGEASFGPEIAWSIERNDIRENDKFTNQYIRNSKGKTVGISGKGKGNVVPCVYVGGELILKETLSTMQSEQIGTGTLSYIQTVYNGYRIKSIEKWDAWKKMHREGIETALKDEGNKENYKEAIQQINSSSTDKTVEFKESDFIFNNIERILKVLNEAGELTDGKKGQRIRERRVHHHPGEFW